MIQEKIRKTSILQQMLVLLQVQILTVLLLILFAAGLTVYSSWDQMRTSGKNLLDIYSSEMNSRLDQAWQNLSSIVYQNYDLDLLDSPNEQERYHASMRLQNNLQNVIKTSSSAQMMILADTEYNICLDANDGTFSLKQKEYLRQFSLECAQAGIKNAGWQFLDHEERTYLYRMAGTEGRVILVVISADSLMSGIQASHAGRMEFVLTDREGMIHGCAGESILSAEELKKELPADSAGLAGNGQNTGLGIAGNIDLRKYYMSYAELGDKKIGLAGIRKKTDIFLQMRAGGLLLVGAALLLLMFDYYIYRLLKRKLVFPMQEAVGVMDRISGGDTDLRLPSMGETLEFITLSDTFNRLMDEVVSLRIQSYEKQIALSDAEEKYIRLQIRPHFFLNAMTTISSLSSTGRTEEIQAYIDALSVNIRYMFTSGLHTVPVREEISHVENYFTMQELKYPDAVFYYIDMPEELGDWPVPQMLIHTLVENEYKYAIPQEGTLTILMRVYEEQPDGEPEDQLKDQLKEQPERILVIEIEDDGQGYPEEVIHSIMSPGGEAAEDGSRVGLYSIKKLLYLMYDREDLFMIGNAEPHGAFSRIRIPERVLHERKKQE